MNEEDGGRDINDALIEAARAFRYPPTPALAEPISARLLRPEPLRADELGRTIPASRSRSAPPWTVPPRWLAALSGGRRSRRLAASIAGVLLVLVILLALLLTRVHV